MQRIIVVLAGLALAVGCTSVESLYHKGAVLEKEGKAETALRYYVEAGRLARAEGREQEAFRAFNRSVGLFRKAKMSVDSPAAALAAEAAFLRLEREYEEVTTMKTPKPGSGTAEEYSQAVKKKADVISQLGDMYAAVGDYKQAAWTVAAVYRIGCLQQTVGRTWQEALVLTGLADKPEGSDIHADGMKRFVSQLLEMAVATWQRGQELATKHGIDTEWSRALEAALKREGE
jgi:hypothetical protein